jgi:hypothetical protein
MDLLNGHPLAMRVVLTRLRECGAAVLVQRLHGRLDELKASDDPEQARLFAALEFVEEADYLEFMAQQADSRFGKAEIGRLSASRIRIMLNRASTTS